MTIPPEADEAFFCDVLELTPPELRETGTESIVLLQAWQEGKNLARWAAETLCSRPHTSPRPDREPPETGGGFYL